MNKTKTLILLALTLLIFSCTRLNRTQNTDLAISFWESEDSVVVPYLDSVIKEFQKNNPNVKVSRTHYAVEDLHTQFQSASIAGSSPDVLLTASDKAGLFVASGLLKPLDGILDFSKYVSNAILATSEDGKIWGVPNNYGNQLMLYYNLDYVKTPPKTTNDLFKICEAIKKNKKPTTCLELNQGEPFWLAPVLTSFNGWLVDGHEPTLNTDAMVKSLFFLKDLKTKGYVSKECDYNCMDSMFKEGKTAMIINGDWTIGAYLESMKGKMGIAVLPVNSATGLRMKPMVSGKYFFVSSFVDQKKLELVTKFIETFNSTANQIRMQKELKKLPALESVFKSNTVKNDPIFSVMAKQIEYGKAMPSVVEMRAVWDIVRQYQGLVLAGKIEPQIAAKRMQEETIKRIEEMKM